MPWVLLVNPEAGRRGRGLEKALEGLRSAGIEPKVLYPKNQEETRGSAGEWAGKDAVVAVFGGDGTINAASLGLERGKACLAPLPGGTENALCRELGVSLDPGRAALQLGRGRTRAWDMGILGGRSFLVVAGVGFDADVCGRTSGMTKRALGRGAFVLSAGMEFLRKARVFSVLVNKLRLDGCWQAVFSNGARYGAGIPFNPGARGDDGVLDAAILRGGGRMGRIFQGLQVIASGGKRGLIREIMSSARLEAPGPLPAQVDGEAFEADNPGVSVKPGALRLVAPQASQEER